MAGVLRGLIVGLALTAPGLPARAEAAIALEVVEVVPDPANPGQFPVVSDGHIQMIDVYYGNFSADYTWSAPPGRIGPEGFTLTLEVHAQNKTAGGLTAGTTASGNGFAFDPGEAVAWARVAGGQPGSASGSLSVTVRPADYLSEGATAELRIGAAWGAGVVYRYRAVAGDGGGGGSGGGGGGPGSRVLGATLDCDSGTIVISALPSLNCHIRIRGWQRNTADPVFVELPGALDTFGNHANGIQVHTGGGQQDVFNWDEPEYSWGIFVFACPSQPGTGANCYGSVTVPGTPSVPIIVRQGGQAVSLTLTLTAVGRGGGGSGGGGVAPGTPLRLGNRWMAGDFLNIEGGPLAAGAIRAEWLSALWIAEPVAGTEFVRLRNVWKPDVYIHTENRVAEAGPIQPAWWSAMWVFEPVAGTRYLRIRNRWGEGQYLHMESGALGIGAIAPGWDSALWWTLE